MAHELKTWIKYFEAVKTKNKNFGVLLMVIRFYQFNIMNLVASVIMQQQIFMSQERNIDN
jgi:hypothetical protein